VPATLIGLRRELSARLPAGVPLVLPRELPAGWGLAAPYIAVGDGGALPNPETWPSGYRVAFTDGHNLAVFTVNPVRLPGRGRWQPTRLRLAGRSLARRADGETVVLATKSAGDWRVALIGIGIGSRELHALAASSTGGRSP
jgi:hypothetical protein